MDRFQIRDLYGDPYIYDTTTFTCYSDTHDNLDDLAELMNQIIADFTESIADHRSTNTDYYNRIDALEDELTDLRAALNRLHEAA